MTLYQEPELDVVELPSEEAAPTRYERQWDEYSRFWSSNAHFERYQHLGDEWGDDDWIRYNVETFVLPYVDSRSNVLEIGPGGGRYSAPVIPCCGAFTGVDVSSEMLERLKARFADEPRAEFFKGNGRELPLIPDRSIDLVYSFNCFIGLELEDFYGYLVEIERVLKAGGRCTLHYGDLSGDEGWKHFLNKRREWSENPMARGRFRQVTLHTVDLLAERAGLVPIRNQHVARDAVVVMEKPTDGVVREASEPTGATRRDFRWIDRYLDDLAQDVYHEEPTEHHTAAAHDVIDSMIAGLRIRTALELGCGAAPALDRLRELGVETRGVSMGAEACAHPVLHADMHFTGLPDGAVDLVVARHIVEHSPMPLLLLQEIHRLTSRYALIVVPCDDEIWVNWPNHYSVLSKPMWNKLFERAGFRVVQEEDGPLEPESKEWRYLLERDSAPPNDH